MISSKNAAKVTEESQSPSTVCRKSRIPSFVSFAGVGCISDVVVLEVNWKRITILNVRHLQIIISE